MDDGFLTGLEHDLRDDDLFNLYDLLDVADTCVDSEDTDVVAAAVESSGDDSVLGGCKDQSKLPLHSQLGHSSDYLDADISIITGSPDSFIPKSLRVVAPPSIAAKMMTALSIFKQSSKLGFLAQVWMPTTLGNEFVLSTYDQPFLLDRILSGYREVSRLFNFATRPSPSPSSGDLPAAPLIFPGLPGRVFISKQLEWTSNIGYYSKDEFLRANYASNHHVRGSLAVPVIDPSCDDHSCCAVLEIATTAEKNNFDSEIDSICSSLQVVNLKMPKSRNQRKNLTESQKSAISEILDVLSSICHKHMLPLALTWVPFFPDGGGETDITNSSRKSILQILEVACYINDQNMLEFLHACGQHQLNDGQGTVGKALQSNQPFFCPDVKGYNIIEYPLAHHARRFGLNASVAIRLRSTHTGNDDYILELFLPVNCNESSEQQLLLDNLSSTMQSLCRSLRTVSDEPDLQNQIVTDGDGNGTFRNNLQTLDARKHLHGKEKNTISLNVLQHYFSGSLKNAAKSIGVCPTTLKRICRQHGISRWPSRKIRKVNRSLKKIQTVIDSVESELKYDPAASGNIFGPIATSVITPSNPRHTPKIAPTSSVYPIKDHPRSDNHLVGQNQNESSNHNSPGTAGSTDGSESGSLPNKWLENKDHVPSGGGSAITIKATYRENMVRLTFTPSTGCALLFEEIGRRFELTIGMFQLKYMDDEEDWITLVNDSDLQECIEIFELNQSNCLRVLVRDVPNNYI